MLAIENIHDLEILRAAADEGSFSAAARALGVTQPAVSQAIARLERQTGATLFDRQAAGREDFLTDPGAVLLTHAITALDELNDALLDLTELEGGRPLRVGLPSPLARHFFPQGLSALVGAQRSHPVEIVLQDSERLCDELRLRHVDLGIVTSADVGMALPHVTFTKMASFPLAIATRREDAPTQASISVGALASKSVPVIAYSGDRTLHTALTRELEREGRRLNVVAETDQPEMLWQLVAAGMGVGLASSLAFDGRPDGIALLTPSDAHMPKLNMFVFEDNARSRGPEHKALAAIKRQLFAAIHA